MTEINNIYRGGVLNNKRRLFLLFLLYRIVLDCSYVFYLSVDQGAHYFMPFRLDFALTQYALSFIPFVALIVTLPSRLNTVISFAQIIFLLHVLIPASSYFGLNLEIPLYFILLTFIPHLILYSIDFFIPKGKLEIPSIQNGHYIAFSISLLLSLYFIIVVFSSGAVATFNLDLSRIYEFRLESRDMRGGGVVGYVENWVRKSLIVFLALYFFIRKKYMLLLLVFAFQIFLFGVTHHRSILFSPILALAIYYFYRNLNVAGILWFYIIVVVLVTLHFLISNDNSLAILFVRRALYVPSGVNAHWLDFFAVHDYVYFSNLIFNPFMTYQMTNVIPQEVGYYVGGTHMNAGIVGAGYAQLGVVGIIIYSLVLGVLLKLLDVFAENTKSLAFTVALIAIPLKGALDSADLFTSISTHGLGISILLIFLARRKLSSSYPKS